MKRSARRDLQVFSLSFLDVICCGFGAIILLLVLTKLGEPRAIEEARLDLDSLVALLEAELFEIRGETEILESVLGDDTGLGQPSPVQLRIVVEAAFDEGEHFLQAFAIAGLGIAVRSQQHRVFGIRADVGHPIEPVDQTIVIDQVVAKMFTGLVIVQLDSNRQQISHQGQKTADQSN